MARLYDLIYQKKQTERPANVTMKLKNMSSIGRWLAFNLSTVHIHHRRQCNETAITEETIAHFRMGYCIPKRGGIYHTLTISL